MHASEVSMLVVCFYSFFGVGSQAQTAVLVLANGIVLIVTEKLSG